MDIVNETETFQSSESVFYMCADFLCGYVFLGISIFLSNWVIKPVAYAWNQQRQFVADASQELKKPLSVIMANAEFLKNEETALDD